MATDQFDGLLKRMPKIAEAVNAFKSEAVQAEAYRTLINALGFDGSGGGGLPRTKPETVSSPTKKTKTKRAKHSSDGGGQSEGGSAVDVNDVVNTMKEHDDFQKLSREVLHKRDLWSKIRLILFFSGSAMTSGEIQKVLAAFDLKTDQPAVSRKLKDMHAQLISSGARKAGAVIRYGLSGPAKSDTQKWLDEVLK